VDVYERKGDVVSAALWRDHQRLEAHDARVRSDRGSR
jgi:hypothetical protein